jgi:hypothetical protein
MRSLLPILRTSSPLLALAVVAACGAKSAGSLNGSGDDGSSSGGGGDDATVFGASSGGDDGGGSRVSSSGGFGGSSGDDSDDGGGLSLSGACSYSTSKGQEKNLDVYIMLDQSLSMLGPKWTGVTAALTAFVQQPSLTGVSVGIQYFALNGASCTDTDYAKPEVEIAPLPGVASMITTSLGMHFPSTVTPTLAAEQGAIEHAQSWAKAHPDDAVIVLLATDGDPDSCNLMPDPVTPVANAAMAGFTGTPKIATFVIGVGSDLANLNQIAAAGGTTSAFIVDTSMNVQTQFLAALNTVRGNALGCQYKIPAPAAGSTIDFTKVNVQFTTNGKKSIFPEVSDKSKCPSTGNAWYYDDPKTPTEIVLCTSTCGAVSVGGEIDVLTGCQSIIK